MGQVISTAPVIENISRIMNRHCVMSTLCVQLWDAEVELDQHCIEEVHFWRNNLSFVKVRNCFLDKKPQYFAYFDASTTGCSLVITFNEDYVCHKLWDPSESIRSSTCREFAAIDFSIEFFGPLLEGSLVKWFTDNQAAAKIVEVGSMKLDLHRLAIKIFQFCAKHQIQLDVQWIPRTDNEKADYISRLIDIDDWQITQEFFQLIDNQWGPHTVDCFCQFLQCQARQVLFAFLEPGASGVDFFVQSLEFENCLVVPPVILIARAVHFFEYPKGEGEGDCRGAVLAIV